MGILETPGQTNNEIAAYIYRTCRNIVEKMVEGGKIQKESAELEWAKLVAISLEKHGLPVPQRVKDLLK
jgi:DNA-binding Lrp family transcriptional regulator